MLFIVADFGFAGANIFYESLLPHISRPGDMDRVSARGYAMGYLGGGILLVVNALWYMKPEWFFMPGAGFALRAAFFSVAVWWALFTLPVMRNVPDAPVVRLGGEQGSVARAGFRRLLRTFSEIKRYRQLLIFLVAFWLYNDGIGTIIKMATAYGDEIGIGMSDMVVALIITQFVGIPFAFAFGRLAGKVGTKPAILLSLGVYVGISVAGYFMQTALHFYLLAFMVGTVQGGSQALSRSLYGAMVPKSQAAEFFGFFAVAGRTSSFIGPTIYGILAARAAFWLEDQGYTVMIAEQLGQRIAIGSIAIFLVVGLIVLLFVKESKANMKSTPNVVELQS